MGGIIRFYTEEKIEAIIGPACSRGTLTSYVYHPEHIVFTTLKSTLLSLNSQICGVFLKSALFSLNPEICSVYLKSWDLLCFPDTLKPALFSVVIPTCYCLSYWNLPIFPHASPDPLLADKDYFNTLIRVTGGFEQMGLAFIEIFKYVEPAKMGFNRPV